MRLDKKGKEVVLKNTGVGRTVDLRAQVNDLHIPTEASEPCHDAGDGVLALVGDLGVPDGLVLALCKTISPYL